MRRWWPYLAVAAVVLAGLIWFRAEMDRQARDRAALIQQVIQLGGKPVVEAKPGDRGPVGPPGPQGEPGPRGPTGKPGPVGAQGPPGTIGVRGPIGLPGRDGTDGRDGADGQDGTDGEAGLDGERGPAGPQGEPGERGPQGEPGQPGQPGRGIKSGPTCVGTGPDSYWQTEYTDGTTERQDGPCRLEQPATSTTKGEPLPALRKTP